MLCSKITQTATKRDGCYDSDDAWEAGLHQSRAWDDDLPRDNGVGFRDEEIAHELSTHAQGLAFSRGLISTFRMLALLIDFTYQC